MEKIEEDLPLKTRLAIPEDGRHDYATGIAPVNF